MRRDDGDGDRATGAEVERDLGWPPNMRQKVEMFARSLAERAAALMVDQESIPVFFRSELFLRVVLVKALRLPFAREIVEKAREEHWVQHGGQRGTGCKACECLDATVYNVQTGGRELVTDFYGREVEQEAAS